MNERDLFLAALDHTDPTERAAYLARSCGEDRQLRERIESLLREQEQLGSFLERPAGDVRETGAFTPTAPGEAATAAEEASSLLGPYKLLELLGEGGMGTVWLAQQNEPVKRLVALKVIKAGMDSRQVIARFEAERQALALMDHSNIARVLDAGTTATGRPYFVMELVKGVPLTKYCDEHRLTPRQRLELFVPVCQAIQHAHQKGIIHRDIKPSNVLVASYDGKPVPKVIDFGIAKATGQQLTDKTLVTGLGAVVGTLEYMSPEQAQLNPLDVDTRADVYSLGVLLYELLTGTTPLERKRLKEAALLEVLRLIREEEPPRPSTRLSTTEQLPSIAAGRGLEPAKLKGMVRGELDWIVMKALEKDRSRRYETANGLALDVQRYLTDEPVLACPPSAWYRFRKFRQRNRGRLAFAGGVLLAVAVMVASVGWAVRDRAARAEESQHAEDARLASVASQVRASLQAARTLSAENKLAAARQTLAAARSHLGKDRAVWTDLAAEVDAADAELERFQQFLELIDRAHEAETAPVLETALAADGSGKRAATPPVPGMWERRPAAAVPFLVQALERYEILGRDDWNARLEGGLLARAQAEQVRRSAYEELLWLADDVLVRREEHRSRRKLSSAQAAREALAYLGKAQGARRPTPALYALRARCFAAQGEQEAAQADRLRAERTAPTLALDHFLRGLRVPSARQSAEAVQAFEAALRLEPTHYWSLMWLGIFWSDLGQSPEDFARAVVAFSGCILKRPDHPAAYSSRASAYVRLRRPQEALLDYSRAIALDPKLLPAWHNRGIAHLDLGHYAQAIADFSQAIAMDPKSSVAWTNRGVAYDRLHQYNRAVADYSTALALDPKYKMAWINRGLAYHHRHQYDRAVADYSRAIELGSRLSDTWYNRGLAYRILGQYDRAVTDLSTAIELNPKHKDAWNTRGLVFLELRQYGKAAADCSRAIELDPKLAMAWYNRGVIYHQQDQYERAVAAYSRAIELEPKYEKALANRGKAYTELHQYDKAIADCSRAIKLDPKLTSAWYNRGIIYYFQGQYDHAVADYSQAIELDRKYVDAWINRGLAYHQMHQYDRAVADCSRAIELSPKQAIPWNNRGNVYTALGQHDKAVADYTRAIELDPRFADAWKSRGSAYGILGQHDRAVADLSRAIEWNPKLLDAWLNRGVAHGSLRQYDKAVADFSQAITLAPRSSDAWYARGVAYGYLEQQDRAVADYSRAIELDPKHVNAWYNRGATYDKLHQYDKAVSDYSKVVALDPKHVSAWNNRGAAHAKLGQHDKAVADFSRAVELNPKHASAWNNRGLAHDILGQYDRALTDYQTAVKLVPAWASAHNALAWLLATCPEGKLRNPRRAVEHASKAVKLASKDGYNWGTLGAAQYRAGDWKAALTALEKAQQLRAGGDAFTWLFLAMTHHKLGQLDEARKDYDEARRRLEKSQAAPSTDKKQAADLRRLRSEAEEVLQLKKQ